MELSEAKEIIKVSQKQIKTSNKLYIVCDEFKEAIDTLLKALDNSISNEQHDLIVKALNDMIEFLKSKLDNSISKDEVRKQIEILDYLQEDAIEENALEDARILGYKIKILQKLLGE